MIPYHVFFNRLWKILGVSSEDRNRTLDGRDNTRE